MRFYTLQVVTLVLAASWGTERANAQALPPESQRTVSWYVAHPAERDSTRQMCLNDPGHLGRKPDCINAKRADLDVAVASANQQAGDMSSPFTTAYWDARPNDRRYEVLLCSRETAADRVGTTCDAALKSMQNAHK